MLGTVLQKRGHRAGWQVLTNIPCPQIVLPPHLERIREKLAENIHELWALTRIEQGWTYGPVRGCLQHEGIRLDLLWGREDGDWGRAFRAPGVLGFWVAELRVGSQGS